MNKSLKKSIVWDKSCEEFSEIIKNSNTWTEVLDHFGFQHWNNTVTIRDRIKEENIDTSHFGLKSKKKITTNNKKSPNDYLIKSENRADNKKIKEILFENNILEEKCDNCSVKNIYNGKPMTLTLDHINGENTDNRIENLRILCYNCHSKTENFTGRKIIRTYEIKRKPKKEPKLGNCVDCNIKTLKKSIRCKKCYTKFQKENKKKNECVDCKKLIRIDSKRCPSCNYTYLKEIGKYKRLQCRICGRFAKNNTNLCGTCDGSKEIDNNINKINNSRTSVVWQKSNELFSEVVQESVGWSDLERKFNEKFGVAVNKKTLRKRVEEEKHDISHFLGKNWAKNKIFPEKRKHYKDLLIKGKKISNTRLKNKIFENNLLENKCNKCGILPTLNMNLTLDHINGDNEDNRLENLRILCYNCHSQTYNFCKSKKSLQDGATTRPS